MYQVKNFGNDCTCETLKELEQVLKDRYRGRSVSVPYPRPSGFRGIAFIDITEEGEIRSSYGAREKFYLARLVA